MSISKFFQAIALSSAFLSSTLSYAHSFEAGSLHISHPYANPTRAGLSTGVAWFGVENKGEQADRITGVSSDIAEHTEIHDMKMENDVMRMFQVDGVDIPAGTKVRLGDGNKLHVMLLGLKQPLKLGDKFTLRIQFEKAGEVPVEVWVEEDKRSATGQSSDGHQHHDHGAAHGSTSSAAEAKHQH